MLSRWELTTTSSSWGHSLLGTHLVSRVRLAFRVELSQRAFFESPTVAGLAEALTWESEGSMSIDDKLSQLTDRLASLAPEQRELLERRLRKRGLPPVAAPGIPRHLNRSVFPLSFAQQRLWFLAQLEPESAAYHISTALRLTGPLDVPALAGGLREIVRRHESLRTTFAVLAAQAAQVVRNDLDLEVPLADLRGLPAERRDEVTRRLAVELAARPFDLGCGPLLRATLVRFADAEHVALLTLHHIVSDGASMGILVRELAPLYEAFAARRPSPLLPLPIQYGDFAVWQRQWLQGEVLDTQIAYWKERLAGSPPVLDLPTDRPHPAVRTLRGGARQARIPAEVSESLRSLGQRHGATLFMVLLAAFHTLLYRLSGQDDHCIGSPVANRTRGEIEGAIGFFANTLVLRADLSGDPDVRELLGRVRQIVLGAQSHQDLPFEKLVEEVRPERSLIHQPLFQVLFSFEDTRAKVLRLAGLRLEPFSLPIESVKFDLSLGIGEQEDGLLLLAEYSADLFDTSRVERLLGQFSALLAGIMADPARQISELPLLTAPERHQLLREWSDSGEALSGDACLHDLVAAQASRTPGREALLDGDAALTYAELEARANCLARYLRESGVGPEHTVGVCLQRNAGLVVSLLAVLKAGGAYVPLDPAYPVERLRFMVEDSGARLVLTREALRDHLAGAPARVVCLDGEAEEIARRSPLPLAPGGTAANLAYVIYTSGSTGLPKGVAIQHRSASALVHWAREVFSDEELDGVLASTSICFDLSVFELFVPLAWRGRVILAADALALPSLPARGEVRLINTVPSAIQELVRQRAVPPAVRTINLAGEPLPRALVDRIYASTAAERVLNLYGPSEDTTYSTWARVPADEEKAPTIGRPVASKRAWLVDRGGALASAGVPGELFLGGAGLARGYLGRPALTAERFVPDPFGGAPGERLYRTGDLARWSPEGELGFLGRADHQVKIRGLRVELGEIEALLAAQPEVREAVVLARHDGAAPRLVAYLVAGEPAGGLDLDALRGALARWLPAFMVPAAFVVLDALPLTSHGKLDRRALPAPAEAPADPSAMPAGAVEERLAALWREVLRTGSVGRHDNFFRLGGDSILSIQIVARARESGIGITPKQIFQHPTVAELAAVAGVTRRATAGQGPVTGPVPLTPIQRWFFAEDRLDRHHFNQALLLEAHRDLAPPRVARALEYLLSHHDALRSRFFHDGAGWRQAIPAPVEPASHLLADLAALPAAARRPALAAAAEQLQASLDLERGPLLRAATFELSPAEPRLLLLVAHHLVVDGVSWRILLADLQTACRQLASGGEVALPAKTSSFQEWAARLEEHASSGALAGELPFWRDSFRAAGRLPVDVPEGRNRVASARMVSVALDAEETRALLQEVPPAYRTEINDVLLTALAQTLAGWTGERSVAVDLEGHGREEILEGIDLTRTVGWLTSLFPVLLDLGEPAGPGRELQRIKQQLRGVPGRGIGFGLLRYLTPAGAEELGGLPGPGVGFNYLGQLDQALSEPASLWPAAEPAGPMASPRGTRAHLLEVNAGVVSGQLRVHWSYSAEIHHPATVERLAAGYLAALRGLIAHCRSPEAGGVTEADFPLAHLVAGELEAALLEIDFEERAC